MARRRLRFAGGKRESSMEPTAWLTILDKLIEVLGLKDLVKDGIKSLSGEGRAKSVGFRFYSKLGTLQQDLNEYAGSLETYVQMRSNCASIEESLPALAEAVKHLSDLRGKIEEIVDEVNDIPQLAVYFSK